MHPKSALLNVMTQAAQKASRGLIRDFGEIEHLQVSKKGTSDFVSTADTNAEKTLVYELKKARPNFGFLLEEGGEIAGSDTSNRWIIDPLDGTTNFLHGIPHFAISIALERDGELFAGVVYEPISDQMFIAERGQGAYLNNNRIRVSARKNLEDAIFATGIPFAGRDGHSDFLQQLKAIMPETSGIRRFGSAALDLAYVAAGRFEGFWESGLKAWDIAAGIVLVREAGGFVTDLDGKNEMLKSGNIIAANDQLHIELSKILNKAAKK
jgi:myo-inositol-1(or 4)-monophosphatase